MAGKGAEAQLPASRDCELAVVIDGLGRGGAQRVVSTLLGAWTAAGRKMSLITFHPPERDAFPLPLGIERHVVGGVGASRNSAAGLAANLRRLFRLRRAIRVSGAPVVVSFIATTNILVILASVGMGVRVVACERSDPVRQSFGPIWDWLRRRLYRHAGLVTANSHGAIATLERFVPKKRLAYVPNPLPGPRSNAVAAVRGPSIITVGRLHAVKAPDVLLRAFAAFRAMHPEWRLIFVGGGQEEPALRKIAGSLNVLDAVDWIGDVDDPYPWLRAARIFALPSRYEGMPNALLEAMASGLPCVVSDASAGLLELIRSGETGLVVPVDDHGALASAFGRLADDGDFASRLGAAAKERVAKFALPAALEAWERAIQRVRGPS